VRTVTSHCHPILPRLESVVLNVPFAVPVLNIFLVMFAQIAVGAFALGQSDRQKTGKAIIPWKNTLQAPR
jgi:hypothetical protein